MLHWNVFLPDYRLAPKYKYPTAPNDAFDTYCWLRTQADTLGIDKNRIAVCGDSAGGNLAAVVCLMAADNGVPAPIAQMLLYPVTDHRMMTESMKKYPDTPLCNSRDIVKYYAMYLPKGNLPHLPYLSPLLADSLTGLPPAYVEVAEFDCLHDEGLAYAEALHKAGVLVQCHEVKGSMHGYDIATDSQLVKELLARRVSFFNSL